jgi:hypothetical protein
VHHTAFNYTQATDNYERIILPHHILISLLQGPSKTEFKLKLLDEGIDQILKAILLHLHRRIPLVFRKQQIVYNSIIALVPFIFEKIKNLGCALLMLSGQEAALLLRFEISEYVNRICV